MRCGGMIEILKAPKDCTNYRTSLRMQRAEKDRVICACTVLLGDQSSHSFSIMTSSIACLQPALPPSTRQYKRNAFRPKFLLFFKVCSCFVCNAAGALPRNVGPIDRNAEFQRCGANSWWSMCLLKRALLFLALQARSLPTRSSTAVCFWRIQSTFRLAALNHEC